MDSVFISYSSADNNDIQGILQILKNKGVSYFKAPESIQAGSNYAREIPKAIKECQVFMILISVHSMNSIWVEKEIDCAVNNRKTILPVIIDDVPLSDMFSFYLNNVQIIKYYENEKRGNLQISMQLDIFLNLNSDESGKPIKEEISEAEPDGLIEKSSSKSSFELELEALQAKRERASQRKQVVTFMERGNGSIPNVFMREKEMLANPRKAAEERSSASHRNMAKRNNALSVNKIPEECEQCGGDLKNVHSGTFKCVSCGYLNYDYFQRMRQFLAENGPRPATEIAAATGIERRIVEYYLLEELLEIPSWSDITLSCQRCGASIRTGRLCEKCKREGNISTNASNVAKYRHVSRKW